MPHASSIRVWAASVDYQPGYLTNVTELIGNLADLKKWMKDVVLIIDVMSLCKSSLYDASHDSFAGLVDYGTAIPKPETTYATEALVFIIVGLTGHWRHPIAYFLQNKCSAVVQTQLIKDCIGLLSEHGIHLYLMALTPISRLLLYLNANLKSMKVSHDFPHPQNSYSRVYVIFDICHMIKLMRNLLGDYHTICHIENGHLK